MIESPAPPRPAASADVREVHLSGYEEAWSSYRPHIQALIDRKPAPRALVDRVREIKLNIRPYTGLINDFVLRKVAHCDLGRFAGRPAGDHLIVSNGRYTVVPVLTVSSILDEAVLGHIAGDVDCVVEFGSGIGDNLAALAARLPAGDTTFIACEPSPSGRQVTELMFSAIPGARLETRHFDYTSPDLGFLDRFRKVVAFSGHSIEQIPVLGEGFYRRLLESPVAACVHLEPVGWQRFTNLVKEVLEQYRDAELWQNHCKTCRYVVDDQYLAVNAASWAASGFYNTDLLKLIADAAGRKEIGITTLAYEIIGYNPFNPSTLIAWTRRRRPPGGNGPAAM